MGFVLQTNYPKEQVNENNDEQVSTKKSVVKSDLDQAGLIDLFNQYLEAGYDVNVKYQAGDETDTLDPIAIADALTKAGIDYKATLKLKYQAPYPDAKEIAKLVDASGFDYNITATLKVNEKSGVNFDHADSWVVEDEKNSLYKITPKASSKDVHELASLYQDLLDRGLDATIDVKPKPQSSDDKVKDFAQQVAVYPNNTFITMTLKEAEVGGEDA